MSDDAIHQPDDKLFKSGFSDPAIAAAFLSTQLPKALSEGIDWQRMRLEPGSFVDSHYRHCESDLLFSAPIFGRMGLTYLLFEHQREPDHWIGLKLLRYKVRIWEEVLRKTPRIEKLPVIIPVVLTQNAQRWELSPEFSALVDIPNQEARIFVPDFTFRLIQLAEMPFEAMQGTPGGILILRALKAEQIGGLLEKYLWDEALMGQVPPKIFELVLHYILSGGIDKTTFERKVIGLRNAQIRRNAMTLAEQYHQEGRQEGLLKGREEGLLEGREEGALIGKIQLLQQMLEMEVLDTGLLAALSMRELEARFRELDTSYRNRFKP